jgi:hypothetical protein
MPVSVPPGNYTIYFYNYANYPYTDEDIFVNGVENDFSRTNGVDPYMFSSTVVISPTDDACYIYGILDEVY